jgi:hypothetical protein
VVQAVRAERVDIGRPRIKGYEQELPAIAQREVTALVHPLKLQFRSHREKNHVPLTISSTAQEALPCLVLLSIRIFVLYASIEASGRMVCERQSQDWIPFHG